MADRMGRIKDLIVLERIGELSEEGSAELQEWINLSKSNRDGYEHMRNDRLFLRDWLVFRKANANQVEAYKKLSRMIEQEESADMGEAKVVKAWFRRIPVWTVAASVLVLSCGVALWYYSNNRPSVPGLQYASQFKNDVAPGGHHAVLTLGNGSQIILDSAKAGSLTRQGSTNVLKLDSGQIAYSISNRDSRKPEVLWNTITTPKGGTYKIVLPDGSKVSLNAGSSLRFPTYFSGGSREVDLLGEGYFEVAKNLNLPFRVHVEGMAVEVLGTSFDVLAYKEEPAVRTTLLKGAIRVENGMHSRVLIPGQQARFQTDGTLSVIDDPEPDGNIAWVNGVFKFRHSDIESVMNQLARWYDVDVSYEGDMSGQSFAGEINMNNNASDVLKVLEMSSSDVYFKIDGKKITVVRKKVK